MGLRESYGRAHYIVQNLNPPQLRQLQEICREVQAAQKNLRRAASHMMVRCREHCEGLCCRNLHVDAVISYWDFVFIIASGNTPQEKMIECLEKETPLFRSDCVFLYDGRGPCIFGADTRPEVCLTSFCEDTRAIAREIRNLKWAFLKINRFVLRNRPLLIFRSIFNAKNSLL